MLWNNSSISNQWDVNIKKLQFPEFNLENNDRLDHGKNDKDQMHN